MVSITYSKKGAKTKKSSVSQCKLLSLLLFWEVLCLNLFVLNVGCLNSFLTGVFKSPYQLLLEDHLSEPLEIQGFKGRKNKKWVFFIVFRFLDGAFWIGNPNGGFGPYVFAVASYRSFIQPASTGQFTLFTFITCCTLICCLIQDALNITSCTFFTLLIRFSIFDVGITLPYYDIIIINTGAQRLVGQDAPVPDDDAPFTAETARREHHILHKWMETQRMDFLLPWASSSTHLSSSSPSP